MTVGIERIDLYAGRLALEIAELVRARGKDPTYVRERLMCERRSVYPPWEDAVTLAVNAAKGIFSAGTRADEIGLVLVGTESAVDFGKPVANWLHRFCNLPANCRALEVKHACYSLTGALMLALAWVREHGRGKKALVVGADSSRAHLTDDSELICGGCSVALLVSDQPEILEIDAGATGFWTREIADTFRPTAHAEVGDNQLSLYSYLDALDGAYNHYESLAGGHEFPGSFKKHIYHAPFPGMALQAHTALSNRAETTDKASLRASFAEKVEPGLRFAKQIGSAYGSSTFLSLLGLLSGNSDLRAGDALSVFAYGSGCQGEFYRAIVGGTASARVAALDLDRRVAARIPVGVAGYEALELARQSFVDAADRESDFEHPLFREAYAGSGLLVLKRIANFRREYTWA